MYINANILHGHSVCQPLLYDESKFGKTVKLEDVLNTLDDSDNGCFVEVDLLFPINRKDETENFPFCPEN